MAYSHALEVPRDATRAKAPTVDVAFRGALKHHGWVAASVRLPEVSESLDPRVLAPAEVELA